MLTVFVGDAFFYFVVSEKYFIFVKANARFWNFITNQIYFEKMTRQQLIDNHRFEETLIKKMLPFYVNDEDALNTLLDRLNVIKKQIEDWEKEIQNDKK